MGCLILKYFMEKILFYKQLILKPIVKSKKILYKER